MLTDDERTALIDAADFLSEPILGAIAIPGAYPHEMAAKLRAIAAPRVATVGELLATAPVGAIVEYQRSSGLWHQATAGDDVMSRHLFEGCWTRRMFAIRHDDMRQPARLVPVDQADADPSTRGPIGEG